MMPSPFRLVVSCAVVALLGACGTKPATSSASSGLVTYYKNVKPILAANCEGCHSATGIGPFDLTTYEGARANASIMLAATMTAVMPPWMPSVHVPFKHERRLRDADIQTIGAWVAAGTPAGNVADMPALTPDDTRINVSATLKMDAPYHPDPSLGDDDYRCFVLDPKLADKTAVTGFNIHPGNGKLVHHVILYNVKQADLPDLQSLIDADPSKSSYTCFGDSRVRNAQMVSGWAPGSSATAFPDGTGVIMEAGSKIVMQVHYNTLTVKTGTDQTSVDLEYTPASTVSAAYIFPIVQTNFSIDPGTTGTVTATFDTSKYNIPAGLKLQVYGVFPHMHLHGTSINVTDAQASGDKLTLIEIPKWNFHWQQFYFYEKPIEVKKGDVVTLECNYDNRQEAQPIINGVQVPAKTLTWGEGTLDEMCLNFFYATLE
jgi:mono/diheme cytochrome c family protein